MCGLTGMITNTKNGGSYKAIDAFENLLYMNALRGWDSTGVALFYTDGGLRVAKEAGCAANFVCTTDWADIKSDFFREGKAILGHNRKKTVGEVKDETSHPFLIDDRFGFIHNGTIHQHHKLANTDVDSEALGMVLTKCEGNIAKIEEVLKDVYGAYACMWIDKDKEKMYIVRNKERPLHYGKFEEGWVFSSEVGLLYAAFNRENYKIEDVTSVPENTLIEFDLSLKDCVPLLTPLNLKKSYPTSVTQTPWSGENRSGVSKSKFKRLSKQKLIGSIIRFELEDYIDKDANPKNFDATDWIIWGDSPDISFPHKVYGNLINVDWNTMLDYYTDYGYTGKVERLEYDPKEKIVKIYVQDAMPDFILTTPTTPVATLQ